MRKTVETDRRYLARFDTRSLGHLYTDTLVIGAGVAGLRAAISASQAGQVLVLVKAHCSDSNTYHAQGGIAAAYDPNDSVAAHIEDTLKTGCGLCNREVVELIIHDSAQQIRQLQQWSMPFDTRDGKLIAGREGGHSFSRVYHAMGDATGKAVFLTLIDQVKKHKNIKLFESCFVVDLLTDGQECLGVVCYHPKHGWQCIWARKTILASGGAGQLYRETTNPASATADGLAMAYRAGATLTDMEFMQFHPTTLYIAGASRTLVTEAIRGEGAYLVDRKGNRFMSEYHEMAELAPRDVVSCAIYDHMAKTNATNVFLDIRHLGSKWLAERFPTINELCKSFDIDVDTDLIPVRPSAHYMVGGVKTDIQGRTGINNLFCCGEAAATGLHGSNRLASNSLLEGLVFGQICGENAAQEITGGNGEIKHRHLISEIPESQRTRLDVVDVTNSLRAVMWRNVGVERQGDRLEETIEIIDFWRRYVMDKVLDTPDGWQCQNMLTVCRWMATSALQRKESRGVHYRKDFPNTDDEHFARHLDINLI
jgi:L-aspartate oxidase